MTDTVIKSEKQRLSETLQVIDRLAIGPVRMEPRRFIAPYSLFRNGKRAVLFLPKYLRIGIMYQDAPAPREKHVSIDNIENNKACTADVIDSVVKAA